MFRNIPLVFELRSTWILESKICRRLCQPQSCPYQILHFCLSLRNYVWPNSYLNRMCRRHDGLVIFPITFSFSFIMKLGQNFQEDLKNCTRRVISYKKGSRIILKYAAGQNFEKKSKFLYDIMTSVITIRFVFETSN